MQSRCFRLPVTPFGKALRMTEFHGFDHIDTRVSSLGAVEAFYDRLLPALGLARKRYCVVRGDDWTESSADGPYNAVEYVEAAVLGRTTHFIGLIEDPAMRPTMTRIAFRVASADDVQKWIARLKEMGAARIEPCEVMETYPAVFFEDPAGTKLEICARRANP